MEDLVEIKYEGIIVRSQDPINNVSKILIILEKEL